MRLNKATFVEIVKHTPLISIDLIIKNDEEEILVGLRQNEPAQQTWFVPGGRIQKDERIAQAFERITTEELGRTFVLEQARFKGVFEHFYTTNFIEHPGFGTHYVVLAYELGVETSWMDLPSEQHQQYQWFSVDQLLQHAQVHPYTKAYMLPPQKGTS